MARILVTGGAGFIGSNLTKKLLDENHTVFCVDNLNNSYPAKFKKQNIEPFALNKNWEFFKGDITNPKFIKDVFGKTKPEKIIHLAARTGVRQSIANPQLYFRTNLIGTINLLEAVKKFGMPQFIFGSSSSVYGNLTRIPFAESETNLAPISPYGISKLAAERVVFLYSRLYKIPAIILRFFTVYGPKGRPDMAPYIFAEAIFKGLKINKFGKGQTLRDYTYVDDIVEGILAVTNKILTFDIINLGNSHPVSLNHLIKITERVVGKSAKIKNLPKQVGDVEKTYASIEKAKKILHWQPTTTFEEGMTKFFKWYIESKRG